MSVYYQKYSCLRLMDKRSSPFYLVSIFHTLQANGYLRPYSQGLSQPSPSLVAWAAVPRAGRYSQPIQPS